MLQVPSSLPPYAPSMMGLSAATTVAKAQVKSKGAIIFLATFVFIGIAFSASLFHHGAAAQDAGRRIGTDILKLVSASTDHEMAAMLTPNYGRKSQAAATIRIYSIGPRYIRKEVGIGYVASAEVHNTTSRAAACAIERPQGDCVVWRIGAYGRERFVGICRN